MTPTLPADHDERMTRVWIALDGVSVGDAFGERFFKHREMLFSRALPPAPWRWTDDTAMAIEVAGSLEVCGRIDEDRLAQGFAHRWLGEPWRGYGGTAHDILRAIIEGTPWNIAASSAFGGQGSQGNGGGMRVAPVGAYFAEDPDRIVEEARRSAQPTHAHPEGQAGAIAVALAAGWAWRARGMKRPGDDLLAHVAERTPAGETRRGLERALGLAPDTSIERAVEALGSGSRVLAWDTVPFAIWSASRHLEDYAEALWCTASGLGDIDTTCAMAGGIVALAGARIPADWLASREPLATSHVELQAAGA